MEEANRSSAHSYTGMITSIAVILVSVTGNFYPIIAPIIGAEGKILKATLKFCLVYLLILGMIVYFGAGFFVI